MKKVLLSLVVVFSMVGVAAATDYGFSRSRIVYERAPVVVEKVYQAPIVERVIEYKEVPNLKVRQFVVEDYGYGRDRIVERVEIRKPQRVIVEKQRIVKEQVVRQKNVREVQKFRSGSGFFGRLLGR